MSITFTKGKSGFIRMKSDEPTSRVLGEFLTTDVAHMPAVVREIIQKDSDEQVIMDSCRVATKGDIVEVSHLYLEELPVFKGSKESLLGYIKEWEQFLTNPTQELQLSLN